MSALNNDHNVYILGAGFSVNRGLPLISGFMDAMRDAREWLIMHQRVAEAGAITKVLNFRLDAASAAYRVRVDLENIEELFSLASAVDLSLSKAIQLAIAATIDFKIKTIKEPIADFRYEMRDGGPFSYSDWQNWTADRAAEKMTAPLYEFYVNALIGGLSGTPNANTARNTFLTFNYDCLVEEALEALRVPFTYGFKATSVNYDESSYSYGISDSAESTRLLKLHGSVNWALPRQRGKKLTVYGSYADLMERSLHPELVAPTWRKIFDGQLNDIWDAAVAELRTATRLIILGFSMPQTDMHFKYLLAAGLKQNISLREVTFVNPDKDGTTARGSSVFGEMMRESNKLRYVGTTVNGFITQGRGSGTAIGDHGRGLHSAIQMINWRVPE